MTLRLRKDHAPKIYTQIMIKAFKYFGNFEKCTFDQLGSYVAKCVLEQFDELEKNPAISRNVLDGQRLLPFPNEVVFNYGESKINNKEQSNVFKK